MDGRESCGHPRLHVTVNVASADVQHCVAKGLMELAAPAKQRPALPPPPPPTTAVALTSRAPVVEAPIAAEGGVDLTWDKAADVIAAVRSRSEREGRSMAADYDRFCWEELTWRGADVAHMVPLAPTSPTMLYHHCQDGDDKVGADRLNTVVSTVEEDTFPGVSLECKSKLVEA